MIHDIWHNLIQRLSELDITHRTEISPCIDSEIDKVEASQNVSLPPVYRDFLKLMGRGAGRFFRGSDLYYPDVLTLGEQAKHLLKEDGQPFELPDDAFVFLVHQGYQFFYFRTGSGDEDPVVYGYMEGEGKAIKRWIKFSDFLVAGIEDHARLARDTEQP